MRIAALLLLAACGPAAPPVAQTVEVPRATGQSEAVKPPSLPLATAPPPRPAEEREAGEHVLVEWHGTWYRAVLLERRRDTWLIHYENYAASWDEAVPAARIRDVDDAKPTYDSHSP